MVVKKVIWLRSDTKEANQVEVILNNGKFADDKLEEKVEEDNDYVLEDAASADKSHECRLVVWKRSDGC